MSYREDTRLSEVDKLIKKIDAINYAIKGETNNLGIIFIIVGFKPEDLDGYEKKRFKITQDLKDAEVALQKYLSLKNDKVEEKVKLSHKIEDFLRDSKGDLDELERIAESYARSNNKDKKAQAGIKKVGKEMLQKRIKIIEDKFNGNYLDDKDDKFKLAEAEAVDLVLERLANRPPMENIEPDEVENLFFQEVESELKKQNLIIDQIKFGVAELKQQSKKISNAIDETGKNIKKTTEAAKKTEKKLETTNAKLKDLLEKIRSGDRICIDIILVLICLGLIAVLYNTIKSRIGSSSTTTTNSSTTKTFLYI